MIKKITEDVINGHGMMDFWFSNTTFNSLLVEANEVRLTDEGELELCFEKARLGVNLKETIYNGDELEERSHVKLLYLVTKKNGLVYEIDEAIRTKNKECIVL